MISVAMLALFMIASYIPMILFLMGWSYATIHVYKLFLEDLVPMSPEVIQERIKAREESQQKIRELWVAVTGADDEEKEISMDHMKESLENIKINTEKFIGSIIQDSESTPAQVARKVTVALRKKVNL